MNIEKQFNISPEIIFQCCSPAGAGPVKELTVTCGRPPAKADVVRIRRVLAPRTHTSGRSPEISERYALSYRSAKSLPSI